MRDYKVLLNDIFEAIQSIEEFTENYTLEQFIQDKKTRDAVIRNIEIIGEASKNFPDDFKNRNSFIDWRDIIAMRNIIAHEYFGIEIAEIWNTIKEDIPELKINLEKAK